MSSTAVEHGLEARSGALRAGTWIGWLSIAAVVVALATGRAGDHTAWVITMTAFAAAGNAFFMIVPWQATTVSSRSRLLLDLWSGGLILFSSTLVILGRANADFDLLFFLVMPFIASVQSGGRRIAWLGAAAVAFVIASAAGDLFPADATAFRLVLLLASVVLALVLAEAVAREASARASAAARAELERVLLAEAHHRTKNSLQSVADLLLLARPPGAAGEAFASTAARIRSIASVHRVLEGTRGAGASADDVVRHVAAGVGDEITLEADTLRLDAAGAQQLGIVANELITNAFRHGEPPIVVRLSAGPPARLDVSDAGNGFDPAAAHLGLQLVRQVVEQGLHGTLSFTRLQPAGMRVSVHFPATPA